MKISLTKYKILVVAVLLIAVSLNIKAQQITAFDQLQSVNALWKNQSDISPALYSLQGKNFTEQQLIQFHLQQAETMLKKRNPKNLSALQKTNRANNLNVLHKYWQAGIFPVNDLHVGRQPYFIDHYNTYCAVGYLMQQSGADEMARNINRTQNFNYLIDISDPQLMGWVYSSGLSLDELALIQPAYDGDWGSAITEIHYNNAGIDVGEYIEIHQSNKPFYFPFFSSIRLYDHLNVLYRTMLITEMQTFADGFDNFYYYQFPSNENLADSGRIEILDNANNFLYVFCYNSSGITQEEYNTSTHTVYRTRQFNVIEDNNTAEGYSLTFCGIFNMSNGTNMWHPSILPATVGILNPCLILAVNLTDFTYSTTGKSVQLKWETATESNSDNFIVERSSDGVNFSQIGKVKAAGNSNVLKQYSLADNNPGYLNHYRLKQVNLDGSFIYSKILYVKFDAANPVSVLLNPVINILKINISGGIVNHGNLVIYDFNGRKLMNLKASAGNKDIDVARFPAGKYMIQLQTADGNFYNRTFEK